MFAGILLAIRNLPVMDLIAAAGFDSPIAPVRLPGAAGGRRARAKAHTYEVHIFNARCGPLKLERSTTGPGSDWVTTPVPYINAGMGASFAVASTSDRIAASASVTYKDLFTNETVTFTGKASGVASASTSQATSHGGLFANGHQGSFSGIVPDVQVDYAITR